MPIYVQGVEQSVALGLFTAQGDTAYATAASVWARLAKGAATQVLTMNAGATAPEWAAGGGGGYTQGARVYHNANQSITTATFTQLAFNSERYDTDSIHDNVTNNSRLTCQTAGKYLIIGSIYFAAAAGGSRHLAIRLSTGVDIAYMQLAPDASVNVYRATVAAIWDMTVGQYVEVRVYQDTGAGLNVLVNDSNSAEFMMQRIG